MTVITANDVADLDVRRVLRNRPSDGHHWWLCLVHDLPPLGCTVTADAISEISRRNNGADVDVLFDPETATAEIVAWLERKPKPI